MRLIYLIIALVIISGLVIYNKNSLLPVDAAPQQTVKEQARQIIDSAKNATIDAQKQMEAEQKRLEQYSK
jgi:hypothetical protein